MRFDIQTQASPEQVRRALTDFTSERLRIWNRMLDPKTYELRDQGPDWAVARERTPRSPFWVVSHYEWSDPALVRWTVVECSWGGGGEGFLRAAPRPGGGSRVHAEWVHTEPRRQKLMLLLLHLVPSRVIALKWAAALDQYALRQGSDERAPTRRDVQLKPLDPEERQPRRVEGPGS
jgi:hypothetical protein